MQNTWPFPCLCGNHVVMNNVPTYIFILVSVNHPRNAPVNSTLWELIAPAQKFTRVKNSSHENVRSHAPDHAMSVRFFLLNRLSLKNKHIYTTCFPATNPELMLNTVGHVSYFYLMAIPLKKWITLTFIGALLAGALLVAFPPDLRARVAFCCNDFTGTSAMISGFFSPDVPFALDFTGVPEFDFLALLLVVLVKVKVFPDGALAVLTFCFLLPALY